MFRRSSTLALLLTIGSAVLAGCGDADTTPVGVRTVRMAIVTGAKHGGAPFATGMAQEVTHTPVWSGDADGSGSALITVNLGQREVCYDLSVSNIVLPATASHIHRAEPGVRGPIVVPLVAPGSSGESAGCVSEVDRALLEDILTSPESFYVNVHTSDYAAGAVRGQLSH